jgi:hypothetical protein
VVAYRKTMKGHIPVSVLSGVAIASVFSDFLPRELELRVSWTPTRTLELVSKIKRIGSKRQIKVLVYKPVYILEDGKMPEVEETADAVIANYWVQNKKVPRIAAWNEMAALLKGRDELVTRLSNFRSMDPGVSFGRRNDPFFMQRKIESFKRQIKKTDRVLSYIKDLILAKVSEDSPPNREESMDIWRFENEKKLAEPEESKVSEEEKVSFLHEIEFPSLVHSVDVEEDIKFEGVGGFDFRDELYNQISLMNITGVEIRSKRYISIARRNACFEDLINYFAESYGLAGAARKLRTLPPRIDRNNIEMTVREVTGYYEEVVEPVMEARDPIFLDPSDEDSDYDESGYTPRTEDRHEHVEKVQSESMSLEESEEQAANAVQEVSEDESDPLYVDDF